MAALTEDALCQWNQQSSRFGTSHVSLSRDPPGVLRSDLGADGDCWYHHDGDSANTASTSDDATETEDEQGDIHMIEEGDDEDDGLYIGANSEDDLTIAFSDIVLPTEEEDPYLNELAAEEETRTWDRTEIGELPMPPLVGAPNKAHVQQENKVPPPAPLSAHVMVAHAVARRQTELGKLTQKELLECLEKRLRPYMMLSPKLPLIRHRKRPNCLFLNHMGTRRPAEPLPKKRKIAATAVASTASVNDMSPLKKRIATAVLPQQGQMPTNTPSEHPTPVTAPPSPQRVVPIVAVDAPLLLPKLLTDSLWDDDLIEQSQTWPKETNLKPAPPIPAKNAEAVKKSKGTTEGKTSEPKKLSKATNVRAAKTKKKTPTTTKEQEDAKRAEVFKVIQASKTAIPIQVSKARKAGGAVDPPETRLTSWESGSTVTPSVICKKGKPESSFSSEPPSQNDVQDEDEDEDVSLGSSGIHEPLAPSVENSFQYSLSQHHDVLSSLSNATFPLNDLDDEGYYGYQSPRQLLFRVQTDDFDGANSRQRYQAFEGTGAQLVAGKKAPPPSFVTLEGPSSSTHQGSQPPRRIPMPRPVLLVSPEMDIVSPRARYAYGPLAVIVESNDKSTSGTPTTPRRPVSLLTSPTKIPPHLSPAYDCSDMFYSHRRASLPYSSLMMEHWLPPSPSEGPASASIVTPDAFASPYNRSKLMRTSMVYTNNDMMQLQSHIPCPPLLTVHPSEGYDSPVSHRRTLPPSPLHNQWKDSDAGKVNYKGACINDTYPQEAMPNQSPKAGRRKLLKCLSPPKYQC